MLQAVRFLLVGMAFGFVLEKTKVYVPSIIVDQMLFRRYTMIQMFLTATAGGMIVMSLLEALGLYKRSPKCAIGLGVGVMGGLGGNALGGFLLGVGMSLSGACPGTVLVQLGAGMRSAWSVLAGAVSMSFAYGYLLRYITGSYPRFGKKGAPLPTLDERFHTKYSLFALGAVSACAIGIKALNSTHPWELEGPYHYGNATHFTFESLKSGPNGVTALVWNPVIGGMALALIQGISILACGQPLGASSAYIELAGHIVASLDKRWRENAPYYAAFLGWNSMMQAIGMVSGAALSVILSGAIMDINDAALQSLPIGLSSNFVGGALLLLGARLAGGCTSGHGISGMAQLGIPSIVTAIGMFAGGTATAFAVHD